MRTMQNYMEAQKAKREESGEGGFSLIELIIVVVILGILAAIAIPIFLNIQQQARENAAVSVAANGATQAAAQIAQGSTVTLGNLVNGKTTSVTSVGTTIETLCVTAVVDGITRTAGPKSNATNTACI